METVLYYVCIPLGILMKWCWQLVGNYGLAIILFTLATKIILIPLSVWTHKNSIQMVKIQPAVNFLKVNHYGDMDTFADEQAALFKKEKYRPMVSLIPLALQIFLLLGVVQIIYHPLDYLFAIDSATIRELATFIGADMEQSSFQLKIIEAIKAGEITATSVIPNVSTETLSSIISSVSGFENSLFGFDLAVVPAEIWGIYILMPVIAGFSSWLLSFTQNLSNVLQHEQSKWNQYGLMAFSVGLSVYLGVGVPAGIAVYWIASNLFSIIQMYILNAIINPKKYVDYEALEASRKALAEIEKLDADKKDDPNYRQNRIREKKDYKRFFSIVNKHLVIYSEKSGFYKYFEALITELTARSNITVHYVTNDPNDVIFSIAEKNTQIKPYYIGLKKMIPLMMKLETDIMVMTTPDLDKYYLKRSLMKKDIEYIYVPHDMMSVHMGFREGALDAFDTIFCTGDHVSREVRATEEVYKLREKKLVKFGYPFADKLIEAGEKERAEHIPTEKKEILIAPSWQEDNLLDSCVDTLIEKLYCKEYHITVRPHPEYVKRYGARMQAIVDRFADKVGDQLSFELDFSKNKSVYSSDLLITDWSGIALEYCFATKRPALFVNTKMKCMNPNWEKIGLTPTEITLRDQVGISVNKEDLQGCDEIVKKLLTSEKEYEEIISRTLENHLYNIGCAGAAGADYILKSLVEKKKNSAKSK
ncbi:MAG: membrane protein insertase YidC [Ruminococcaceae bacterium]|nr:membrane protein insertase YidC [Oscillospiraceae bacterium]